MIKWIAIMLLVSISIVFLYEKHSEWQHKIIVKKTGATAVCNDGFYSTSSSKKGACSGHGGVKRWVIR